MQASGNIALMLPILEQHDAQVAARYLQRALELDPTDLEVLRVASLMTEVLQLDVPRFELISQTLTRDVRCTSCFSIAANYYFEIGEEELAKELQQRRIDVVGDEAANYAVAYRRIKTDPEAALRFLRARPDLGPE
jgi:tetratricopeptide (TPR) repeat protein